MIKIEKYTKIKKNKKQSIGTAPYTASSGYGQVTETYTKTT